MDPDSRHYVEVPYRILARPSVTLWEHRQAVARLRQQGRDQVDEQALFTMIEQMRGIAATAQKATRKSRRDRERRRHLSLADRPSAPTPPPGPGNDDDPVQEPSPARPFDDIEDW